MKKDYVAPKLTELGDIKEITQSDPNGSSFRRKSVRNVQKRFRFRIQCNVDGKPGFFS